jgi:hypothetical protein
MSAWPRAELCADWQHGRYQPVAMRLRRPEVNPETKKKDVVWFALNEDRRLFAFAGIWTMFNRNRGTKSNPIPGPHLVVGF